MTAGFVSLGHRRTLREAPADTAETTIYTAKVTTTVLWVNIAAKQASAKATVKVAGFEIVNLTDVALNAEPFSQSCGYHVLEKDETITVQSDVAGGLAFSVTIAEEIAEAS